jgi:transposase
VEPARFFVHRHIRPQYACRRCETVTAAPVPASLIDGGLAAPGLHAWVLIQKYLDHLPLYRIEKISERHGAPIARSTLAQWVGQLGLALQPLVDRLSTLLKRGQVLHADETPVQQLDPGQGKTRRAYLCPIEAMSWRGPHRSSSSTIKPAAAANMPGISCKAGKAA